MISNYPGSFILCHGGGRRTSWTGRHTRREYGRVRLMSVRRSLMRKSPVRLSDPSFMPVRAVHDYNGHCPCCFALTGSLERLTQNSDAVHPSLDGSLEEVIRASTHIFRRALRVAVKEHPRSPTCLRILATVGPDDCG